MASFAEGGLLEREAEVERLDQLLDAARSGSGQLVLIEGPAGVGKTRLLAAARELANDKAVEIISARGDDLERDFPHGVVRQLFEVPLQRAGPRLRESLLEGAAAYAAPVLTPDAEAEAGVGAVERSASVLHGLYWLTSNLAEERPLVLMVDDAHWSDHASLEFISYLGRRVHDLPVLILLAVRSPDPAADEEAMARVRADHRTSVLALAPLEPGGVTSFVRQTLDPDAEERFCAACHLATGGNPFLLRELVAALSADGVAPTAEAAPEVAKLVPEAVRRHALARVMRLSPEAGALARALAVLGGVVDLRHAAALAELDEHDADQAADELVAAGLLRAPPLQFVHPLIREAIYGDVPPAARARAHARAARLLSDSGAAPDRIAAQLLACEPAAAEWVTDVLRAAARDALARGAPDAAVTYLRRALDEPPIPAAYTDVVRELGSAEAIAGHPGGVEHLQRALELTPPGRPRALIARQLSQILMPRGSFAEAVTALDTAIQELGEGDRELALELAAEAATAGRMDPVTYPDAIARLSRFAGKLDGRTPAERLLLANLAFEQVLQTGKADEAAALAERAVAGGLLTDHRPSPPTVFDALYALVVADSFEPAQRACDLALSTARADGSLLGVGATCGLRSHLAFRRGAIAEAESEARTSLRAAEAGGFAFVASTTAFLIDALSELGELGAAEQALGTRRTEQIPDSFFGNILMFSRGRLRIASGDREGGLADLRELGEREKLRPGGGNPGALGFRSSAALALAEGGELAEAWSLVDEELRLAEAWGSRRAIGVALRAKGVVNGTEGVDSLRRAVEVLDGSGARLELARALADLGAAIRRTGQRSDAREPLRRALDLARRCGATVLQERTLQELLASGARPRRLEASGSESLTPSERRIAAMAVEGRSNREIAQALFLSLKTVEMHLGNSYRKLDIKSRSELAGALDESE